MLLFYINFGDHNPPYPAWAPIFNWQEDEGNGFTFFNAGGLRRKQAWRNPKEGRVGCLHKNIFARKVTDIAFTSDFCNTFSHPASPASLFLTSPRPILDVLKSLVSRPQVPSPHTRVLMSPSHFYTQPNNHRPTELHVASYQSVYDARSTPCPLSILKQGRT